jgi:PAT family beta-lactamase induction signal transducer AmpG
LNLLLWFHGHPFLNHDSHIPAALSFATSMKPRHIHPWVFMVLITPFGVVGGYVSVTLAYQLKLAGVSVSQIAALVALTILPQTWKFFWAPVVDLTLTQKKWYILAGVLCAVGTAAMGWLPATRAGLTALSSVVFLTSLACTFLGMSVESLLAYGTPKDLQGHASGWFQAGNLGGSGIGGGLGLLLVDHLPSPWMASTITGILCLICCIALMEVPSPVRTLDTTSILKAVATPLKELWALICNRNGLLAFVLCFLPIGTGAVLFSAIAREWSASATTVALITGLLGGVISAIGCIVGGWFCDRMDRKKAYLVFGIIQAISCVAMALLPRTQLMFILWASVYTFSSGLCYAAFSAFVLEVIGKGAAATKYNALASLSNAPIYFMTNIDGWAHDHWNSSGMFFTEAGLAVASSVLFIALVKILMRWREPSSISIQSV